MKEIEPGADKLQSLRLALARLEHPSPQFNQLARAKRVCDVLSLCDEAVAIRKKGQDEWEFWQEATTLLDRAIDEAYPDNFDKDIALLKAGDAAGLETAVRFIEADPWFFRSGYIKADLLKYIGRVELSESYKARLRAVVLHVIDFRGRREFVSYCRLAKKIQDSSFRQDVRSRIHSENSGIRRRARWVLSAITHNKNFHLDRGAKQLDLGNYSDALGDFNRALLLAPQSLEATLYRGIAYGNLEMFEEAIAEFDRMMDVHDESLSPHEIFWMRGVEGRLQRAWCYSHIFEYSKAVDDFSSVIKLDPENWYAYRGRGRAYYNLREYDKAVADLQKSISICDTHTAHYLLGITYMKQSHLEMAMEELKKSIEPDVDDYDSLVELSNNYFLLKKYQEAFDTADQAIGTNEEAAIGWCCRGKALFAMHSHTLAFADFNRSAKLGWAWPTAFLERGIAFAKCKKIGWAIRDLTRVLALEAKPEDDLDINAIWSRARTWLGWIYASRNEHSKALDQFSAAITLDCGNSYSYRSRGQAKLYLGMYESALADLQTSISILDTSQARYLIALIYRKQFRQTDATREIYRAIKLNSVAKEISRKL